MLRRKPAPKNDATRRERNGGVKPFFRAQMKTDGALELLVYEEIGEYTDWWTGETSGISASLVKEQLDSKEYSSILMRINSPGGDAFEGVAILNVLRSQGKPVNVMVDGIAASAASIIAMAGTTIQMGSGAMMMIHNAWGGCVGNCHDMAQQANALAAIDKSIAQAYVDRTGGKLSEIVSMMDAETWMTAEDCINLGFATGIQQIPEPDANNALAMARGFRVLNKFNRVPEKLKNAGSEDECQCDCPQCQDGDCAKCSNEDCEDPNCVDCPMQAKAKARRHHNFSAGRRLSPAASVRNTAVATHSTATSDKSWDASANEKKLPSPLKTSTAKKMYAWIPDDTGDEVNRSDCKFPHHEVSADGTPGAANIKACQSGIGNLNGARGGTTIPADQRKGVYNHLARHIKDSGAEPPEFQDEIDTVTDLVSAHGRIEVMASMLRTSPAMDFQMHDGKTILALRKSGSAVFNLVQGSGSAAVARVSGLLAPYNSASCDLGGFCEVYLPGCFADSIKEDDPLILHTHNIESILGCKSAGTARFSDEADGLHYEVDLPDTQTARDLRVSMERGDIKGSSAAFFIDQYRWENRAGVRTRVIEKARLVEGGPHPFAAYSSSTAAVEEPAVQEVSNNEIEQLGARLRLLKVA